MFENKKIFVLGMARSGYEVSKLLSNYNNQIVITDKKEQNYNHVKELENLGVSFIKCDDPIDLLDETFDYVVKNPGIRFDHPIVEKAKKLGIKVLNEVEVAYHFLPKDTYIIAITGSNGKTTTTTICYELIKQMGKKVHLGGNIGYPLSGIVSNIKSGDILVIEISVQQLFDLYDFNPNISILTNLIPVHIDFTGSYENYILQKLKIFKNHDESNIAIINKSNKDSCDATRQILSKKIYFSSSENADACIKNNAIYYNNEKIVELSDIKLKGMHNYENIMCAIIATKQLGIKNSDIKKVLSSFCGVEHRMEFVTNVNGRDFYNDSKATNVKSTEIALNSFKSPIVLILGGLDRGHSFDELSDDLKYVKYISCFGETKYRIKEFAEREKIKCDMFDNLSDATINAYKVSNPGDTILLSPACASWDQYESFEQRGEEFKKIISQIKIL